MAIALMLPLLMACATLYGADEGDRTLPPVPADLQACSNSLVPAPARGKGLTRKQAVALIGKLKLSETSLCLCNRRLIAWYECQMLIRAGGQCPVPTEQSVQSFCRSAVPK